MMGTTIFGTEPLILRLTRLHPEMVGSNVLPPHMRDLTGACACQQPDLQRNPGTPRFIELGPEQWYFRIAQYPLACIDLTAVDQLSGIIFDDFLADQPGEDRAQ